VNTDGLELTLYWAGRRVREIQTKLHRWANNGRSDMPTGLVESPVLSNGHAGFGRRAEETDQSKDRHRASSRPHRQWTGKFGQVYASGLRRRRPSLVTSGTLTRCSVSVSFGGFGLVRCQDRRR
jgi:hypothetical protein